MVEEAYPQVPLPADIPPIPVPPPPLSHADRDRRNGVGNILAQLLMFTSSDTPIAEVRRRIYEAVNAVDMLYLAPTEELPTFGPTSPTTAP